jgi:hypothetical protein
MDTVVVSDKDAHDLEQLSFTPVRRRR